MAGNSYETANQWDPASRYTVSTAVAATGINIGNPSKSVVVYWTTTDDDNEPGIAPTSANPIAPLENQPMQPLDGKRIWFASQLPGKINVED